MYAGYTSSTVALVISSCAMPQRRLLYTPHAIRQRLNVLHEYNIKASVAYIGNECFMELHKADLLVCTHSPECRPIAAAA
jgi:hypothetical protein